MPALYPGDKLRTEANRPQNPGTGLQPNGADINSGSFFRERLWNGPQVVLPWATHRAFLP